MVAYEPAMTCIRSILAVLSRAMVRVVWDVCVTDSTNLEINTAARSRTVDWKHLLADTSYRDREQSATSSDILINCHAAEEGQEPIRWGDDELNAAECSTQFTRYP
ncbi:uncharacterized protein BCR38DRAFT_474569 [Pseudomassariella vexata]|uniref:Uncharacterized protein n=1 Tax=Pseudomassariella vexata TaxID=1141098 RepID=A0A1Y2DY28_9PEZI|nr:uncharacterized protein BCR38DRAFT_474569 [Pseudomassariella vexata]ORY64016.1 hypothetical protein BCR38DRAFT_474569 [Pseudomassariella vexata]